MAELSRSDQVVELIKSAAQAGGMIRQMYLNKAQKVHKAMTEKDLKELVHAVQDLSVLEYRMLWGIGLRNPAREKIAENYADKVLAEREQLD